MYTRGYASGVAALFLLLAACQPKEVEVSPPEVAEVDVEEPAEVEVRAQPGAVTVAVEPPEVEFERAFPITAEDIGDLMLASGTVVGKPGPTGFFLRTEGNRVVFVESTIPVTVGQRVQAVGPLQAADVAIFEGWERDVLGNLETEWDLLRLYYIRADAVVTEVEFENVFPITAEDVGDLMLATGTVVGKPGPTGFFLRTEGNRVVFVQSAVPVTVGQRVQAIGPLQAVDVAVFEGWERDFLGNLEAEWDLLRLYYIRANSVAVTP